MTRIACLHTADSNISVFDSALAELGKDEVKLIHAVRSDLLFEAEAAGAMTPEIERQAIDQLCALSVDVDAVIMTCSTLGPAAALANKVSKCAVFRVDEALALKAARYGGKIVALCAVETTVDPTKKLFESIAIGTGANVDVQLVKGAWGLFKAGDQKAYLLCIAKSASEALAGGASVVALAQSSMAGAKFLIPETSSVLDSPTEGLLAAISAANSINR